MQFANYTDFRVAVLKLIDGDDANSGALAQDTLDLLIALGESRVYQGENVVDGLRVSDMEQPLSLVVTANTATIPTNCLALKRVQFSGELPLDYLDEHEMLRYQESGGGGPSRYYSQQGRSLTFFPATAGTVGGRYYARPVDIATGGLHATFNRYPECFLFGALSEAAPFLGEDSRIPVWKTLWAGWMEAARKNEASLASAGSRLYMRPR